MKNKEKVWIKGETTPNWILQSNCGNFCISFNERPWGSDCSQTALSLRRDDLLYILDGDHRKEYENIIDEGFERCLEYFNSIKEDFKSVCSN